MKKVLFLVNHPVVIFNFRKELVEELLNQEYEVLISCPYGSKIEKLIEIGCTYIETPIERHGTNFKEEVDLFFFYRKLIKTNKPDVVLTYTIKPNIYGTLASTSLKVPAIVNITGLGSSLQSNNFKSKFIMTLYRKALQQAECVFFQNEQNKEFFLQKKASIKNSRLVPGSGVNLKQFALEPYPLEKEKINFLFVGRIMKDKGIEELIAAASIIKERYPQASFDAIGFYEDDYKKTVDHLNERNFIKFHGSKDDIINYLKNSHAIVLPSYHEGMANVLLEAAAVGRPILASDIPGCRETFEEGISGLAFKSKNVDSLVQTLICFLELPYKSKEEMGLNARRRVETIFDRNIVINAYLKEIEAAMFTGEERSYEFVREN